MFQSNYQSQQLQLPGVFCTGGQQIDTGGVDGAVAQKIGQLDDVPGRPIEGGGEQVPQVVGEDLRGGNPRFRAEGFHLPPNRTA